MAAKVFDLASLRSCCKTGHRGRMASPVASEKVGRTGARDEGDQVRSLANCVGYQFCQLLRTRIRHTGTYAAHQPEIVIQSAVGNGRPYSWQSNSNSSRHTSQCTSSTRALSVSICTWPFFMMLPSCVRFAAAHLGRSLSDQCEIARPRSGRQCCLTIPEIRPVRMAGCILRS